MEEKKNTETIPDFFSAFFPLQMSYILNVILLKDTGNEMLD